MCYSSFLHSSLTQSQKVPFKYCAFSISVSVVNHRDVCDTIRQSILNSKSIILFGVDKRIWHDSKICRARTYKTVVILQTKAMFTLYRTVKRSFAETVPERASVHTRNVTFEPISAPEQDYLAPFLNM